MLRYTIEEDLQLSDCGSEADDSDTSPIAEREGVKWFSVRMGRRGRWRSTVDTVTSDKTRNNKRQRNVAREESGRIPNGNRIQAAGRMNLRDSTNAKRIPAGKNGSGRRRLYFPSDVVMSFHEQLLPVGCYTGEAA